MLLQMAKFHSFLWLSSIWLCVCIYIYIPHPLYLFICWWTLRLHILAIVNNTAIKIRVHVSFWINVFVFFRYTPWSGIARSYGSSIFSFLKDLHIIFHSCWTNLHSHQQCTNVPFSPYPHQHLLSLVFLIIPILTGVRWPLMVLIEHLIWFTFFPFLAYQLYFFYFF